MHKEVLEFVQKAINDLNIDTNGRLLEIGSRNWNGTPRHLFGEDYTGIDKDNGNGVDLVMDATDLEFNNNTFDIVLCLEVLEHAKEKDKIMSEFIRVLKTNGVGIITAAAPGRPIHDGGTSFYGNVPIEMMEEWIGKFDPHYIEVGPNEAGTPDIRGYFVK